MRFIATQGFPLRPFFQFEEQAEYPNNVLSLVPEADFEDTGDHYVFTFDLPGVPKEGVSIRTEEGVLSVDGTRTTARGTTKWHRSLRIPKAADLASAEAHFENGVLTVGFAKAEVHKARTIALTETKPAFLNTETKAESSEKTPAETH